MQLAGTDGPTPLLTERPCGARRPASVLLALLFSSALAAAATQPGPQPASVAPASAHGATAAHASAKRDMPPRGDTGETYVTADRNGEHAQQERGSVREPRGTKQRGALLFLLIAAGTGTPG